MDMKLFGKSLERLFKSEKEIIEEGSLKPIKTIQDLEALYKELGDDKQTSPHSEWENNKVARDFKDQKEQFSAQEQDAYDYWENAADPRKHETDDVYEAGDLADEEDWDMKSIDDLERSDIIGGGKAQRMIDAKKRWSDAANEALGPFVENENPHTPREKLSKKDLERQERMDARSKPANLPIEEIKEEVVETKEIVEKAPEKVEEQVSKPESVRVKPEVKVELEKVEKPMNDLEKFKLMKEVVAYNALVGTGSQIDELRPKRGDLSLSFDQISTEMKAFRKKEKEHPKTISQLERDSFDQCQLWIWAVQKIEGYKGNDPHYPNGQILSKEERNALQKEYFAIKGDKNKFARLNGLMSLEVVGNKKVESGEWKKGEFAWKEEKGEKGSRWYAVKGADLYYTYSDPSEILGDSQSAEFFYTVTKQEVIGKGEKLFISIKFPKQEKVLA